jgi:hypothetical protein
MNHTFGAVRARIRLRAVSIKNIISPNAKMPKNTAPIKYPSPPVL